MAVTVIVVPVSGVELRPHAVRAYEQYVEEAKGAFLNAVHDQSEPRVDSGVESAPICSPPALPLAPRGRITAVSDGLVHHWVGGTFLPGVALDRVLAVAQAYEDYPAVHKPIIRSELLGRTGDTYRVFMRIKEDAGVVAAVLDVWSVVQYQRRGGCAYSLGHADEIREVKGAGLATEMHLAPGRDSGYLWRANTLTRFVERDGGVYIELQTFGLSRRFPALLKWLIEPIVRRTGRNSVDRTLDELRRAVLER